MDIAQGSDEKSADRIRALDTLGRFGLGAADQAAVHIHADEGAMIIGVVHLPTLDVVEDVPSENGGSDYEIVQDGATLADKLSKEAKDTVRKLMSP